MRRLRSSYGLSKSKEAKYEQRISLDQFPEFVSDMLSEVEFLEVAQFCGNNMLTDTTLKELGRKN